MDIVAVLLTILTISLQENINDLEIFFFSHRNQSDISLNQMRHETSKMLVIIL